MELVVLESNGKEWRIVNMKAPISRATEPPSAEFWITAAGTKIPVNQLTDRHIQNILAYDRDRAGIFRNSRALNRKEQFAWVLEEQARRGVKTPPSPARLYAELFM